jgi:hypothetical protein
MAATKKSTTAKKAIVKKPAAKPAAKPASSKASSASRATALAASRARTKAVATKAAPSKAKAATKKATPARKAAAPRTITSASKPQAKPQAAPQSSKPASAVSSAAASSSLGNVVELFSPQNYADNSPFNTSFKGADSFKDMMSTSSQEWQKIQDKISGSSEEVMAHLGRTSETMSSMAAEGAQALQRSIALATSSSSKTAEASQAAMTKWFDYSNRFCSDAAEQSKKFLNCRNAHDVFELQNEFISKTTDSLYKQASESSATLFEAFADVAEPMQDEASKVTEAFFANLAK